MSQDVLTRMRSLIGGRFDYLGDRWTLVEVLAEDQLLVLRRSGAAAIQTDQYGRANRRSEETLLIPVFGDDDELTPELTDLLKGKRRD